MNLAVLLKTSNLESLRTIHNFLYNDRLRALYEKNRILKIELDEKDKTLKDLWSLYNSNKLDRDIEREKAAASLEKAEALERGLWIYFMIHQKMGNSGDKEQVFKRFSNDLKALHNFIGEGGLSVRHNSLTVVDEYINNLGTQS
jgi:hypothetical protein